MAFLVSLNKRLALSYSPPLQAASQAERNPARVHREALQWAAPTQGLLSCAWVCVCTTLCLAFSSLLLIILVLKMDPEECSQRECAVLAVPRF